MELINIVQNYKYEKSDKTLKELLETKHDKFEKGWSIEDGKVVFWFSPTVKLKDNYLKFPSKYVWKVVDGEIKPLSGSAIELEKSINGINSKYDPETEAFIDTLENNHIYRDMRNKFEEITNDGENYNDEYEKIVAEYASTKYHIPIEAANQLYSNIEWEKGKFYERRKNND